MISAQIGRLREAQTTQTTSPAQNAPALPRRPIPFRISSTAWLQREDAIYKRYGGFKSQRYPEALATFKLLLNQLPGDDILSKYYH